MVGTSEHWGHGDRERQVLGQTELTAEDQKETNTIEQAEKNEEYF